MRINGKDVRRYHRRAPGQHLTEYHQVVLSCLEKSLIRREGAAVTVDEMMADHPEELLADASGITNVLRRLQLDLPSIRGEARRVRTDKMAGGKRIRWRIEQKTF